MPDAQVPDGHTAEPHSEGLRAVLAALGANVGIAVTKLVAFAFTGSASMLAESVHSLADSGNQALLLLGRSRARQAQTEEHPFGFGRERYFYAFVVAVVLFTVGAVFSLYEGVHKIISPEQIRSPVVAFVVLGIAMALESFSLRTAVHETNLVRGRNGWTAFIRRAKAPELPAILLEDLAALTGLVFATAGVALTVITGNGVWDGAGSLAIGVLLGCVAAVLAVEMKSLLIGESAERGGGAGHRHGPGIRSGGAAGHPPADPAHGPGEPAGRGQDRDQRGGQRGAGGRGDRRGRAAGPQCGADRRDDLPGAGYLPPGQG